MMKRTALTVLAALFCTAGFAADVSQPSRATLTTALENFLSEHGDVCVAKYDWPIDVSLRDVDNRTRDAVQMPALEQQGLVKSSDGYVVYKTDGREEKVPTRRYELTDLGRRYYKVRETLSHPHPGKTLVHHADLCAGHLSLDAIVQMNAPTRVGNSAPTASVSYRYRFTPDAWVQNEQIWRVFPMLETLMQGQGKMEMTQKFHFDGRAWVPDTEID